MYHLTPKERTALAAKLDWCGTFRRSLECLIDDIRADSTWPQEHKDDACARIQSYIDRVDSFNEGAREVMNEYALDRIPTLALHLISELKTLSNWFDFEISALGFPVTKDTNYLKQWL